MSSFSTTPTPPTPSTKKPLAEDVECIRAMRDLLSLKVRLPTEGGRLVEAMTDERLLRFLRARKFDVDAATDQYARYMDYRVSKFGKRPLRKHAGCDPLSVVWVHTAQKKGGSFLLEENELEDDNALTKKTARYYQEGETSVPVLLLDLAKLDLAAERASDYDASRVIESIWCTVDAALASQTAQLEGFHVVVDARVARPKQHVRPQRLKELVASVVDRVPARVASIKVVGAPRWLSSSWFALGPVLKSKLVARATIVSMEDAKRSMPQVIAALSPTTSSSDYQKKKDTLLFDQPKKPKAAVFPAEEDKEPLTPEKNKQLNDDAKNEAAAQNDRTDLLLASQRNSSSTLVTLSRDRILSIQHECEAFKVPIPDGIELWDEDDVIVYFATDGQVQPSQPRRRRSSQYHDGMRVGHRQIYS